MSDTDLAREELVNRLDLHLTDREGMSGCRLSCGYDGDDRGEHLADVILADFDRLASLLGYVKADADQWGYRRELDWSVGFPHSREEAQRLANLHPGGVLVRRLVGHSPWEVVDGADAK